MALRCSRVSRCMRSVSIPHQGSARDPRCWTVSRLLRDHRVGNHLAMGTRAHPQECRTYRGLRLNELRNCGVNDFPDDAPRSATIGSIRGFSLSTCFSVRQCGYGGGERSALPLRVYGCCHTCAKRLSDSKSKPSMVQRSTSSAHSYIDYNAFYRC